MNDVLPCLYVFVDTDLKSMNPGKMAAHSGHAANAFVEKAIVQPLLKGLQYSDLAGQWRTETSQGFGTQINLKASTSEIYDVVKLAQDQGFVADLVYDPTYPYIVNDELVKLIDQKHHTMDPVMMESGDYVCFRKEMTAGYVFGDKNSISLQDIVGNFPLHD